MMPHLLYSFFGILFTPGTWTSTSILVVPASPSQRKQEVHVPTYSVFVLSLSLSTFGFVRTAVLLRMHLFLACVRVSLHVLPPHQVSLVHVSQSFCSSRLLGSFLSLSQKCCSGVAIHDEKGIAGQQVG